MLILKYHHLISGSNTLIANIEGNAIESEDNHILLGITIYSDFSFNKHINNLCKKASVKLNAFAIISGLLTFQNVG